MANIGRGIAGAGTGAYTGAMSGTGPIGIGVGAGIGLLGGLFSGGDEEEQARAYMQKALAEYEALGMPPDISGPIIYQQLQAGGKLTPQLEGILKEELFNASTISDNQDTRADLMSGLNQLRAKSFGTGLSPEQMANQQKLLAQVNAGTQANMRGILQGQASRGQSGSGDSLAAMLNAGQAGAQQNSQNALQIGAQGINAQDAALRDYLQGLGALRSQDQSREGFNASAQNTANMFKAQNASARQARNVGAGNQFNQLNWNRQNSVNDYNTQMGNQELLRQREAQRQHYMDKLALAQAKAGAYGNQANMYTNMANNSNQSFNNILQGVGGLAGSYGQYQNDKDYNELYKKANGIT